MISFDSSASAEARRKDKTNSTRFLNPTLYHYFCHNLVVVAGLAGWMAMTCGPADA